MVSRIVRQITYVLQNKLMAKYIKFPNSVEEKNVVKQRFFVAASFPGAIGLHSIDCTQIKIKKPSSDIENCYINRKGYFSKNVQLICDYDLKILSCFARFGGSSHDAFIWQSSRLKAILQNDYAENGSSGWLIGDSGYPLQPWLMTPYRNPENASQQKYNDAHIRSRNCVERLKGVLKKVFACLSHDRGLMVNPAFAGAIINACCTLHNIRKKYNLPMPEANSDNYIDTEIDNILTSNSMHNEARAKATPFPEIFFQIE